jgi:ParB family transcriptional regulator, chromosome partitioning protein
MTKKGEGWISRRGQAGAASAVELVLERQPQEPVQQIADELIEDSPYQARGPINDASVSELAQGMSSAGFQGVLIVRPHGDATKRRQGIFQLVYGHRRRAAWRFVCQERREPCVLPVVVREVSDAQMLTIGAQENLQRQDLDPVEEAQLVAWAERMFFDKNQAEIGAMLGKSSDWVSTRSRIHKLPEFLKAILLQRPRAIGQALELAGVAQREPGQAAALAEQVVRENLTLEALRTILRAGAPNTPTEAVAREALHNRRDIATIVRDSTNESVEGRSQVSTTYDGAADASAQRPGNDAASGQEVGCAEKRESETLALVAQLKQAVVALEQIAGNASALPVDATVQAIVLRAEHALVVIRRRLPL